MAQSALSSRFFGLFAAITLALAGCSDDPQGSRDDAGADAAPDVVSNSDVAANDTAAKDTATKDTATSDAGPAADTTPPTDTAPLDSGPGEGDAVTDSAAPPDTAHDTSAGTDAAVDSAADTIGLPACTTHTDCPPSPNPCANILCAPNGVCAWVYLPDKVTCDDGDACTLGEKCDGQHQCSGGGNACGCSSNADCAKLEDGNPCNGTLFCDDSGDQPQCKVNPATIVQCPPHVQLCHENVCKPSTGECTGRKKTDNTPCEDGDKCTEGEACFAGLCLGGTSICDCKASSDCAKLEDGNPCNGTLFCDNTSFPHKCKVNPKTVVACPTGDDTDCLKSTCAKLTGTCSLTPVPSKTPCDDGNKCTKGDHCTTGLCKPGTDICPCKKQADCGAFEDGNPCTGTLYCNFGLQAPACTVNPATVITCPTAADDTCKHSQCNKKTGVCGIVARNHLGKCEDGNPCTNDDKCTAGKCIAKVNACQCKADSDCAKHEDGDACNGTLYCDKSEAPFTCKVLPSTVVRCNAGKDTACLANRCQKKSGQCLMTAVHESKPCDADGNPCTQGDLCEKGACSAGTNVCKCEENDDCAKHEDGNACNGTLYCNKLGKPPSCEVNPATVLSCPDGNDTACTKNQCQPATGSCAVTQVNQGQPCDGDGNACTPDDHCDKGDCKVGTNVCACTKNADCAGKDDGNLCNGALFCDTSALPFVCKVDPVSLITCPPDKDKDDCIEPICVPFTGKCTDVPREENAPCSDGNVCTFGDICATGKCQSGKNLCTCTKDEQCVVYDDGDFCNGVFWCDKTVAPWACKPKPDSKVSCPKSNSPCASIDCRKTDGLCTVNPINPKQGGSCEDGDACTVKTTCVGIACSAGAKLDCDDSNPCTHDACQTLLDKGCVHLPVKVTCDDGDVCTVGDVCADAKCKPGAARSCDDGNVCTDDSCKAGKPGAKDVGCAHVGNASQCEDGNKCSVHDSCKLGSCNPGKAKDCDDQDVCTNDSCKPGSSASAGCQHAANSAKCDDGNACTGNDHCDGGLCVGGDQLGCNDGNVCTDDFCDPGASGGKACKHTANTSTCEDGKTCSAGGLCANTVCKAFGRPKLFSKHHGGTGDDAWHGVVAMDDGGAVLAGYTSDGAKGGTDGWLLRIDRGGTTSWQRKTGDAQEDRLLAVAKREGGAVAAGWTKAATTGQDAVIIAVDAGGKKLWSTAWNNPGDDRARGVTIASNGNVVVVGDAATKPVVLVLSKAGTLAHKAVATKHEGALHGVIALQAGALAAAGTFKVSGKSDDCALVFAKADGTLADVKLLGGSGAERCLGISAHQGGFALVGSEAFGADKTKMALWRTDSGGGLVWKRSWAEHPSSVGLAVAETAGGGLQLGGEAFLNVQDLRLLHVGEHGAVDWAYNYGLGGLQQARSIAMLPDGGMYVAGVDNYGGSGGNDGWLMRLDPWGYEACYNSGGCADTSFASCVDNNPCTRDVCTHKKGCHHPNHATYTPCGGSKICGFGECK